MKLLSETLVLTNLHRYPSTRNRKKPTRAAKKKSQAGNGRSASNPLRLDPTRTATLRRQFEVSLKRRFAALRQRLYDLLVKEDVLGLKPVEPRSLLGNYDPDQLRDEQGRWLGGGAGSGGGVPVSFDDLGATWRDSARTEAAKKVFEALPDDALVTVYHGTTKERAESLVKSGKVATPEGYVSDLPTLATRDLYVAPTRADAEKYGGTVVSFTIRKGDMQPSPEALQYGRSPSLAKAFFNSFDGAVVSSGREIKAVVGNYNPAQPASDSDSLAALINNAREWASHTDPEKLEAFTAWLRTEVYRGLGSEDDKQLWERYIRDGFQKGAGRAFEDTTRVRRAASRASAEGAQAQAARQTTELFSERQLGGGGVSRAPGSPAAAGVLTPGQLGTLDLETAAHEQFLRSAFAQPVAKEKLKLLTSRSFAEMENVTEDMANRMSRVLADGLVRGAAPGEVADGLADELDISQERALLISRTELIRAHAEGQLTALEQLGVEEVGVAVEWAATDDERLCPRCAAMEGVVLKIAEARGLIPLHPRCRCSWVPANLGEEGRGQKDTAEEIEAALEEGGLEIEISTDRPESIFNQAAVSQQDLKIWFTSTDSAINQRMAGGYYGPEYVELGRALLTGNYNPDQPRDDRGRWGDGGDSERAQSESSSGQGASSQGHSGAEDPEEKVSRLREQEDQDVQAQRGREDGQITDRRYEEDERISQQQADFDDKLTEDRAELEDRQTALDTERADYDKFYESQPESQEGDRSYERKERDFARRQDGLDKTFDKINQREDKEAARREKEDSRLEDRREREDGELADRRQREDDGLGDRRAAEDERLERERLRKEETEEGG